MATTQPERIASALRLAAEAKPLWIDASGGSMGRAIVSGSELLVRTAAHPRRGEVWAFCKADGAIVAHRYRGRTSGAFVFEGDVSSGADRPVAEALLIGRVVAVRAEGLERHLGRLDAWRAMVALQVRRVRRLARRRRRDR